jgi:hypothetical protein
MSRAGEDQPAPRLSSGTLQVSVQLVPKLYLGTTLIAKFNLAGKWAFPSSAWERGANHKTGPFVAKPPQKINEPGRGRPADPKVKLRDSSGLRWGLTCRSGGLPDRKLRGQDLIGAMDSSGKTEICIPNTEIGEKGYQPGNGISKTCRISAQRKNHKRLEGNEKHHQQQLGYQEKLNSLDGFGF